MSPDGGEDPLLLVLVKNTKKNQRSFKRQASSSIKNYVARCCFYLLSLCLSESRHLGIEEQESHISLIKLRGREVRELVRVGCVGQNQFTYRF